MSASMRLHCDEGRCPHEFRDATTTEWLLRLAATNYGWTVDERGDYCPIHPEMTHDRD